MTTPLRVDRLGGYICLTCIDRELQREQTPTPDVPGLVERARAKAANMRLDDALSIGGAHDDGLLDALASRIEALEAEVERLRMAVRNDTATIGKYEEHRQKLHAARTTAEAERDALKAEVGRKVSREDATKFLEVACRNWRVVPQLTCNDFDDVAQALGRFFVERYRAAATMYEDARRGS